MVDHLRMQWKRNSWPVLDEPEPAGPAGAPFFEPKLTVTSVENHIYFYADVNPDRCLALVQAVRRADTFLRTERDSRCVPTSVPPTPIWLHIQTLGGDMFAGMSVADQLSTITTPVWSVVEGVCASAGTLISLACSRRLILPSSVMLIHQLSSGMWGTHEQFKDEMNLQEMLMQFLTQFYAGKTKIPADAVPDLLKRNSWFNAQQCLANGMADEIWTGV